MSAEFDIGFVGGGQLARMSIQAAQRMGLQCLSIDAASDSPAAQVSASVSGNIYDAGELAEFISACERITFENEFVPASTLAEACAIAKRPPEVILPGLSCLATIQDKLTQRRALSAAGIPNPKAMPIADDGTLAIAQLGFPMVIKARKGGYDGKGTRLIQNAEAFEDARTLWEDGDWLAEEFVPFKRELAVMVYRSATELGAFPTMESVQSDHVCDLVFPANCDATDIAVQAVLAVDGYGLFGVELFELSDGSFQVNEIAPRPHNSGHYTLDWGGVSQFEQHIRLVMGLPCAQPSGQPTCMANLLGRTSAGDWKQGLRAAIQAEPKCAVHWYGKSESRPGRKMGHINVSGERAIERARLARAAFYGAWSAPG